MDTISPTQSIVTSSGGGNGEVVSGAQWRIVIQWPPRNVVMLSLYFLLYIYKSISSRGKEQCVLCNSWLCRKSLRSGYEVHPLSRLCQVSRSYAKLKTILRNLRGCDERRVPFALLSDWCEKNAVKNRNDILVVRTIVLCSLTLCVSTRPSLYNKLHTPDHAPQNNHDNEREHRKHQDFF